MPNSDVLIVGAGPTGLVLALWLTKLGVKVRIIDRTAEPGTTSRALAVQARTLELYRQLDLAEAVIAQGHEVPAVNLWVKGEPVARLSLAAWRVRPQTLLPVRTTRRRSRSRSGGCETSRRIPSVQAGPGAAGRVTKETAGRWGMQPARLAERSYGDRVPRKCQAKARRLAKNEKIMRAGLSC